ncbi:hypothetical protein KM043_016844 [Ampulex compressa]|nr:hypothetical protein KM043_016844 [Ampulex compressa]
MNGPRGSVAEQGAMVDEEISDEKSALLPSSLVGLRFAFLRSPLLRRGVYQLCILSLPPSVIIHLDFPPYGQLSPSTCGSAPMHGYKRWV